MDREEKQRLVALSELTITNYFNKTMSLQNAIKDKLQFRIKNDGVEFGATVALATGNLPVQGVQVDASENPIVHHHNCASLLQAGYDVNAILDDMTEVEKSSGMSNAMGSGNILVMPVNSDLPIAHAKEYLKHNPRFIKSITLICDDEAMFDGSMSLATLSPFHRENTREVELTKYFSVNQYRSTKIVIDMAENELQWNDNLLWTLNGIPNNATVTVFVEFYD